MARTVCSTKTLVAVGLIAMTLCVGVILAQFSANLENCLGDFKQKKAKMIRLKDIDSLESCTPISPEAGQAKPGGIVTPASFNAWKSYVFKIVKSTAEGCEPILTNALQLVEARYIKKARPNDVGAYHRYCHWVINIQSIEDDSREVSLAADENPDLVSCREAVANLDESEELDRRSDPLLPTLLLIQNLYIANYGSWYYEKHIEMDKKEIVELVMGGLANNADQLKESGFARMSRGSQGIRAAIDAVKSIHGLNGRERDKIPLAVGDEFVHYCGKIVKELEKVFRGEKCRNLDTDYVLFVLKALEGKRDDTFKLVEGAYAYLFCSLMTNNYESPDYLARRVREYFQDEDRYNAILLS